MSLRTQPNAKDLGGFSRLGRARASALFVWLLAASACGTTPAQQGSSPPEAVAAQKAAIHLNPGNNTISVSHEPNAWTGQYPQVTWAVSNGYGCTGTIIAPYAVLTAHHCNRQAPGTISWQASSDLHVSPWAYDNPYLFSNYTPDWWIQLNQANINAGGSTTDWPAMHDEMLVFVPDLSPQFLASHQINPIPINPYFSGDSFTLVGLGNTLGGVRDSVPDQFVPANPNTISVNPRDGYLSFDVSTPNFGTYDPGDSGGPSLACLTSSWTDGSTFVSARAMLATTNGPDTTPLGYYPGITMTPNQQNTVRLNSLWAMARADDADGDGLPLLCDSDPSNATASVNLCPAPIGAPVGSAVATVPSGQLACPFGYYPVGLKGQIGASLTAIAVECRPVACFGATTCTDSYSLVVTDPFGGTTDNAYETVCATGERMTGLKGTSDANKIYSLTPQCLASSGAVHQAPTVGPAGSGTAFNLACGGNNLQGFQARSTAKNSATGLHALCAPALETYMSGPGPTDRTTMQCPPGQVVVGLGYSIYYPGYDMHMAGVLCNDRAAVAAGQAIVQSQTTVLRAGYEAGFWVNSSVEPDTTATLHAPPNWTEVYCPTGSAMTGVTFSWDSTGTTSDGNAAVSGFQQMHCQDIQSASGPATTVPINAGNIGGAYTSYTLSAAPSIVDGVLFVDGLFLQGLGLHAIRPPAAPTSLKVSSVTAAAIGLTWNGSTSGVAYSVYRSTTTPFTPSANTRIATDLATTTYSDTGYAPSLTNYYYVEASNPDGSSWPSNEVSVAGPPMSAPTGLVATAAPAASTSPQIILTWNAMPGSGVTYNIYGSAAPGFVPSTANLFQTNVSITNYTDSGQSQPQFILYNLTPYYYAVAAARAGGESLPSSVVGATTPGYQIDCGVAATGTPPAPWLYDQFFTGGSPPINHANLIDTSGVTNPAPMVVYQTSNAGTPLYTLTDFAPGSSHLVRLHFADTYYSSPGSRVFGVTINGTAVLKGFDIAAAAGNKKNKAVIEQFTVKADASGNYNIQLVKGTNTPMIAGIEIQ
jgi:hypothetical protein